MRGNGLWGNNTGFMFLVTCGGKVISLRVFTILYGIQLQKPQRIGTQSTRIVLKFYVNIVSRIFIRKTSINLVFFVFYMYANYSFNMRNT